MEILYKNSILTVDEKDYLGTMFANIERYLSVKDETAEKEMSAMGDNDYICWSDRILAKGELKKSIFQVYKKVLKEKTLETTAEELEDEIDIIRPIYKAALRHMSEENAEETILRELTNENK